MKKSFYLISPFFYFTATFATETPDSPAFPIDSTSTPSVAYKPEAVTTQPKGLITPTVAPRVKNGENISIDADFIWWKAQVSQFDTAQTNEKSFTPPFQFEPGLKIGTGMDLFHDGWDVYSEFTFLYQPTVRKSKETLSSGTSSFITPSKEDGSLSVMNLSSVQSSRRYQFNILDLEAGRNFFISKRLTLRPHVGFKAASLFEKTREIYIGTGSISYEKLTFRQNLSGVGLRSGIDTVWHVTRDFGFYGDAAFTALWGSFHNTLSEYNGVNSFSFYKSTQTILPVFEMGLGLTYMAWFAKDRYELYLKAGWEEQIWLSYNQNRVDGLSSANGSLTLQGLTFKTGFVF